MCILSIAKPIQGMCLWRMLTFSALNPLEPSEYRKKKKRFTSYLPNARSPYRPRPPRGMRIPHRSCWWTSRLTPHDIGKSLRKWGHAASSLMDFAVVLSREILVAIMMGDHRRWVLLKRRVADSNSPELARKCFVLRVSVPSRRCSGGKPFFTISNSIRMLWPWVVLKDNFVPSRTLILFNR